MKTSIFALALTATATAWPLAAGAQTQTNQVYSQQQMSNQSYGNMQNLSNDARMRRRGGMDAESLINARLARGTRFIKAKRASTKFQTRPFPLARYMKTVWNGDDATRKRNYAEWLQQSALWQREMKARNAQPSDIGDMYALAAVVSYEAHTGKRLKNSAFVAMRSTYREFFLKAPFYQGANAEEKQDYYVDVMLPATNALRARRCGQIEEAQTSAAAFFDRWMGNGTAGALRYFAPFQER